MTPYGILQACANLIIALAEFDELNSQFFVGEESFIDPSNLPRTFIMASTTINFSPQVYSIPPLSARNYATWSIKIEMLFLHSKLCSVVDGTKVAFHSSDLTSLTTWKLKDSKATSNILLHCNEKQLIFLCPLITSKVVWDCIKQFYEKSNKASQVHLHKQLCHMQMSESDVITFLELWQSILQEAAILRCTFTNPQQVNLLLGALPNSWSASITTQGGIANLTFTYLLSNILQQNSINLSKTV